MDPWWTDQQAGMFGGIAGSMGGILGAAIGTIGGICAPRGKCRHLIYGMLGLMATVGIVSLVAGIVALSLHQPYGVYYPLLLIGLVSTVLGLGGFPLFRMRYREADARRLDAEELRRS
jgi:hypothetical protein